MTDLTANKVDKKVEICLLHCLVFSGVSSNLGRGGSTLHLRGPVPVTRVVDEKDEDRYSCNGLPYMKNTVKQHKMSDRVVR